MATSIGSTVSIILYPLLLGVSLVYKYIYMYIHTHTLSLSCARRVCLELETMTISVVVPSIIEAEHQPP